MRIDVLPYSDRIADDSKMAASKMILGSLARKFSSQTPVYSAAVSGHGPEGVKRWKNLTLFVALPAIVLCTINTYLVHEEEHKIPRPEFVPYEHMRIRNKRFAWGDGVKSLFHNPHVNALPTGYEEEDHH